MKKSKASFVANRLNRRSTKGDITPPFPKKTLALDIPSGATSKQVIQKPTEIVLSNSSQAKSPDASGADGKATNTFYDGGSHTMNGMTPVNQPIICTPEITGLQDSKEFKTKSGSLKFRAVNEMFTKSGLNFAPRMSSLAITPDAQASVNMDSKGRSQVSVSDMESKTPKDLTSQDIVIDDLM